MEDEINRTKNPSWTSRRGRGEGDAGNTDARFTVDPRGASKRREYPERR